MRLTSMFIVATLFWSVSLVAQRGGTAEPPTGTAKDDVRIVQVDGTTVTLLAQKSAWRPIRGALRAKSRLAVPATSLVTVVGPVVLRRRFQRATYRAELF
jgi:hypothetical protein